LKSAYSGALVHTVSPYVIPCYYMLIYLLCQVFFDEITIFFYTEMAIPDHPWNSHHSPIQNVPLPP
jgi:hypothetical protein